MIYLRFLLILFVFTFSGCATTIQQQLTLPDELKNDVNINSVRVLNRNLNDTSVASRLKSAIEKEAVTRSAGKMPLDLEVVILEFHTVSSGVRFWTGVFSGSNSISLQVTALDVEAKTVAEYGVVRSANPGGLGAFFDQEQSLLEQAAKGVLEGLYGPNGR